jgi:hypothetical protein
MTLVRMFGLVLHFGKENGVWVGLGYRSST